MQMSQIDSAFGIRTGRGTAGSTMIAEDSARQALATYPATHAKHCLQQVFARIPMSFPDRKPTCLLDN